MCSEIYSYSVRASILSSYVLKIFTGVPYSPMPPCYPPLQAHAPSQCKFAQCYIGYYTCGYEVNRVLSTLYILPYIDVQQPTTYTPATGAYPYASSGEYARFISIVSYVPRQ